MGRPYMICHILSALDGKIAGTFMGTEAAQSTGEEYARIRSAYQAEAWVNGTTTTKEFTHDRKPIWNRFAGTCRKVTILHLLYLWNLFLKT